MEYSIISTDLKSSEIKPEQSLKQYIDLTEKDIATFFTSKDLSTVTCPACESKNVSESFTKLHIEYSSCANCFTTYASKRPNQKSLNSFYQTSKAREFWIDHIWKDSESSRVQKILSPTIDWIKSFVKAGTPIAEVLPNNPGFYKAWGVENKDLTVVQPVFPHSNSMIDKNSTSVLETNKVFGSICLFDALDRAESPRQILKWANDHLEHGGFVFITGILSSGFDSLLLGQHSRSLLPPDRLNSFSLEAIGNLAQEAGFETVELSTPGVLDLQNIKQVLSTEKLQHSRFLEYILKVRPEEPLIENFQRFLQENQLSSRARIVLKKRGK